jgi:hypothetical protein
MRAEIFGWWAPLLLDNMQLIGQGETMPVTSRLRRYLRLPCGIALLLGFGALSAGSAAADVPEVAAGNSTVAAALGGTTLRAEGGKIYLREGGRESELQLGATPERERLLRLLEPHGATGVKLGADPRLIMSSGGGAGFSLRDVLRPFTEGSRPAPNTSPPPAPTAPAKQGSPPQLQNTTSTKKG